MSCGVGCRHGLDTALLWLWHRPVAMAPIGLLAWESPYAARAALEKAKRQKQKTKKTPQNTHQDFSSYPPWIDHDGKYFKKECK